MLSSEFTRNYMELYLRLQRLQWENYADGASHDLNIVDADIYQLLRIDVCPDGFTEREQTVYSAIVSRGLVDKHPEVARLRNQLDDWDYYLSGLEQISDRQEKRVQMSAKMRPDVVRLLQLRDELARSVGFPSYVDLVLSSEDLERDTVVREVTEYLTDHLPRAKKLAAEHGLRWSTWFTDLATIAGPGDYPAPAELAIRLFRSIGLPDAVKRLTLVCKDQRISGYTGIVKPGVDVRVLLGSPGSLEGVRTLCHELGHALAHLYNEANGLLQTWTASYDESMAVLFEQIGIRCILSEPELQTARDISLLENVRCAISFLFELDLWQQPERAEELYLKHYGLIGIPIPDPVVWASDSFRSIDPVYIHNYLIGAIVAERLIDRLPASTKDIGPWLVDRLYKDGRQRSLYRKLADIEGCVAE